MRTAALLAFLLLAGCLQPPPTRDLPSPPPSHAVAFIALGDAGTGGADQFKVAAAIETVCHDLRCDFAVGLGDNLYDSGASSDRDPQFDSKFEKPYASLALPFWLALGNHDNSGDPLDSGAGAGLGTWYEQGDNEVAYSSRTDRASDKWHMPARFYTFDQDGGNVSFYVLDTNTLLFDDVPIPPKQNAAVQAQGGWIDGALAKGDPIWRIAMGHHPYLSNGPHGNAGAYDGRAGVPGQSGDYLKQFFLDHVCGKVDLYLAGHDHDLEWLQPAADCAGTALLVSGGGGASTYALNGKEPVLFQKESLGFWWMQIDGRDLTATAFDADGQALYTNRVHKS